MFVSFDWITYRIITAAYDHSFRGALDSVGGEESQVLGLQRVFVGELGSAGLRLRLAGQTRVVHFEAARFDDADVSGDPVAELYLIEVIKVKC